MSHTLTPTPKPSETILAMTGYVARWPLRHIYGGAWLRSRFGKTLNHVGSEAIAKYYGLYFRDSETPPKIDDLILVTFMQTIVLVGLGGGAWFIWQNSGDWALGLIFIFSAFYAVPTRQDFLTEGSLADRLPNTLKPLTSALSFIATLPAMTIALPAALLWGVLGGLKVSATSNRKG